MAEKQRVSKPKKLLRVFGVMISILFLLIVSLGLYIFESLQPFKDTKEKVVVDIPMDSSLKEISKILEENEVVKNATTFYYYARYQGKTDLKAGKYQLNPSMNVDTILSNLKDGKSMIETVTFTVPEGYTVRQIALLLEEKGITTKKDFFKAVNFGKYSDVWYLNRIPNQKNLKYRLEGFLFPKTYTVNKGTSAEEIVRLMLEQTETEFPKEWLTQLRKNKISFYEAITLASIVEREAIADSERSKIAGVYYNRLKDGMKLQADATVQYVMDEQKDRLLYSDLEVNTRYNTYMHEGLPPGPISNPGIESIKAVVFPNKHHYLFYVTKKDDSGEHYFSKTFEQHEHYIRLSKKQNQVGKDKTENKSN